MKIKKKVYLKKEPYICMYVFHLDDECYPHVPTIQQLDDKLVGPSQGESQSRDREIISYRLDY